MRRMTNASALTIRDNPGKHRFEADLGDGSVAIAEYNLLALPVIDDEGDIAGIVTVDDAMEILLPKNLQRRLPRLFS